MFVKKLHSSHPAKSECVLKPDTDSKLTSLNLDPDYHWQIAWLMFSPEMSFTVHLVLQFS